MIRRKEIDRLSVLYKRRLDAAVEAVQRQAALCRAAAAAQAQAQAGLDGHDDAERERENRFMERILGAPVAKNGLDFHASGVLAADHRRAELVESLRVASENSEQQERTLLQLRMEEAARRRDADKLREVSSGMSALEQRRGEARSEAESDEFQAARGGRASPC